METFEASSSTQKYCSVSSKAKQNVKEINCVNNTKTEDVVKIADRADLHIASKYGYLQEIVRILRDKEQLKLKRQQIENERLLKSTDNDSDAIDVDSEEYFATV